MKEYESQDSKWSYKEYGNQLTNFNVRETLAVYKISIFTKWKILQEIQYHFPGSD